LGGQVAVERGVLEDEADVPAHLVAFPDHVVTGDERAAAGRVRERAEHADRGGLAGAVRAEEPEHLAGRHLEVDALDGLHFPVRLGQPSYGDRGIPHHVSSARIWNTDLRVRLSSFLASATWWSLAVMVRCAKAWLSWAHSRRSSWRSSGTVRATSSHGAVPAARRSASARPGSVSR